MYTVQTNQKMILNFFWWFIFLRKLLLPSILTGDWSAILFTWIIQRPQQQCQLGEMKSELERVFASSLLWQSIHWCSNFCKYKIANQDFSLSLSDTNTHIHTHTRREKIWCWWWRKGRCWNCIQSVFLSVFPICPKLEWDQNFKSTAQHMHISLGPNFTNVLIKWMIIAPWIK